MLIWLSMFKMCTPYSEFQLLNSWSSNFNKTTVEYAYEAFFIHISYIKKFFNQKKFRIPCTTYNKIVYLLVYGILCYGTLSKVIADFYAPTTKSLGAYWFSDVRPSVIPSVRLYVRTSVRPTFPPIMNI